MRDLAVLLGWVAVGSAAGGLARFFVSGLVARAFGETFPWGTMVVNVTGAFAIGVLAVISETKFVGMSATIWPLAVTGFLGSYTTVSSFSLQTLALVQDREWFRAAGNVLLSLVLCLSAATAGMVGARAVLEGGFA